MGIKCHLNITPSKECYEVCVQSRWCGALKAWESDVNRMTDYGDCKGCKHLVIYEDSFGCDAQHDLCDDVCPIKDGEAE